MSGESVDVAIVGGGPAGAILAASLAATGRDVVVLERAPAPRWRACGVFTSPATGAALRSAGIDAAAMASLAQPIPAMRVETPGGTSFRLTYGDDGTLRAPALGFDRPALDERLLQLAVERGGRVMRGATVTAARSSAVRFRDSDGAEGRLAARVVVGADGLRSVVARDAGVVRGTRFGRRIGFTFHVEDPRPPAPRDARMILLDGAYCGLAPVPGGRVNVGIVLASGRWRAALRRDGAAATARRVLEAVPRAADDPTDWAAQRPCDPIEGAAPVAHAVRRRAGGDWVLVGDAAGFLDPFTGEGLHRALVSSRLAAAAVERRLRGERDALRAYDRAMRARFAGKDLVTSIVQGFLAGPAAFEYVARRLEGRPAVRETMGLVMGDLVPAHRAFDPRFIVSLLRP